MAATWRNISGSTQQYRSGENMRVIAYVQQHLRYGAACITGDGSVAASTASAKAAA